MAPVTTTAAAATTPTTTTSSKNCRVYVGNLSWDVTSELLKEHVQESGVTVVIRANVMTGADGRSKGCGIVEFETPEAAQKAILTLNDTQFLGRQIFVREDREASGPNTSNTTTITSDDPAQSRRCYVGNLSWDVAWQDLKDHMREAGEVIHAEVITEPNGRSKGCGIVEYATADDARKAIATLSDTDLKGRMIFVREDREISTGAFSGTSMATTGGNPASRRGGDTKGASVYVWNLSYDTTWQNLKDHMRAAGNVDSATILTNPDGRSMGAGIVVYQQPKEAARAIRELQQTQLNDRPLFVREDRGSGRGGGGRGGGQGRGRGSTGRGSRGEPRNTTGTSNPSASASGTQLFVSNLSFDTSWQNLKDHFHQCGEVEHVNVMEGPGGRKKGVATVRMTNAVAAEEAIKQLNGIALDGRNLEVRLDQRA